MASNEIELEEQLKEVGNRLLNPPPSFDELLNLLDKVEHLLINVEQAPSRSMQDALLPAMKALISSALLRHSDADVKVSVTSCISEITRITAPDSPYNDDQMKEIFQLTVASFENLSHGASHCYTKAVSILDTVAKVRSCLVMLDLEQDELIIEMFQCFLKIIRSNHPHAVFWAMETIMTLVIDESEDISIDLLAPLLASATKENQSVSPIAWKLGEKVLSNCTAKLKPYLTEAVQSVGIALDGYAPIVGSICLDESHTLVCDHVNGSGEHLMSPDVACPAEVFEAGDGTPKSKSNGTASSRNPNSVINLSYSKILEHCSLKQHFGSGDVRGNPKPQVKLEKEPDTVQRKRGRKPNSLMNPEEGYDHSWICTERKTAKPSHERKCRGKGTHDTVSENQVLKKVALSSTHVTETEPKGFVSKTGDDLCASFPSTKQKPPNGSHPKKGRPKKKGIIMKQDAEPSSLSMSEGEILGVPAEDKSQESFDVSLGKQSEERSNSKEKQQKCSRKTGLAAKTDGKSILTPGCIGADSRIDVVNEPEKKPLCWSTEIGLRGINKDKTSVQTSIKKGNLVNGILDEVVAEASGDKEKKPLIRDGSFLEGPPKTKLKRKCTPRKEMAFENPQFGSQLIGCRIKVWWPMDKKFYDGVVDSYYPTKKRHRVLYADGDEETLNLKKQRWELIRDNILLDQGQDTDLPKPNASSDVPKKSGGKAKSESESPKQRKAGSSLKRNRAPDVSKTKARRSGAKSADRALHDIPPDVDKPSRPDGGSKVHGKYASGKLKIGSRRTTSKKAPQGTPSVNVSPGSGEPKPDCSPI